mmetsp:Transcript_126/g.152  ORF Transcript_126/g.152 Transcript_126/m.152 type:complete len:440 (+) Transcript_126:133-1452(+)
MPTTQSYLMPSTYLLIIQMMAAFVSFLSSFIMANSIALCGIEEATPYRRIILGLSISDIFQSLALLTGPLSVPLTKMSWEAANEVTSCQANGFVLQIGATATVLHTVYLCFYYLCKLKYRMSDEAFRVKVEGKIRAFIVVFCLISGIVPLAMDAYHTTSSLKSFCTISPVPTGCWIEPEVVGECDAAHAKRDEILKYIYVTGLHAICFLGIIVIMGLLYRHTYVMNQLVKRETEVNVPTTLRDGNIQTSSQEDDTPHEDENTNMQATVSDDNEEYSKGDQVDEENHIDPDTLAQPETPRERLQHLSRLYHTEMTIQATSYVAVCLIMYLPMMISFLFNESPEILVAVAIFIYPLGGFLNILVYTRPKVAGLRRAHPACSWFRGFWLVLKSGGEIPTEVDFSVSYCEGCCRPSAWIEDSDYEYSRSRNQSFGIHLSSWGF